MSNVHWAISRGDDLYPASFEELHTPPQTVYGMGDPAVLSTPCISIIGARRATPYGLSIAQMGARVSAECGITVVSGGAMGCDAAAARAALLAGAAGQTSSIQAPRKMSTKMPSEAAEQ